MSTFGSASAELRRALLLDPGSDVILDAWCRWLIAAGDWDELAVWAMREAAGRTDPEPLYRAALGQARAGDAVGAGPRVRALASLVPASPGIWALAAEIAEKLASISSAAVSCARALALAHGHGGLIGQLSRLLVANDELLGRFGDCVLRGTPEAVAAFAEALAARPVTRSRTLALGRAAERAPEHPSAPAWLMRVASEAMAGGRVGEVRAALRRVIAIAPLEPDTYSNLSEVTREDDPESALLWARRSLAVEPVQPHSLGNLALAYQASLRFDDVEATLRRAIASAPAHLSSHVNLSHILLLDGRAREAEDWAARALALDREDPRLPVNLAYTLMTQGKVEEGYPLYEHRLFEMGLPPRLTVRIPRPRWAGEPLRGRSLLVWAEQGIGDHFFFARYLPMIHPDGGTVIVECDARLVDLYRRSFPDLTIVATDASVEKTLNGRSVDLQVPITSLPFVFLGETRRAIDAAIGGSPWPALRYFKPDPLRVSRWEALLARPSRPLRVAVSWRGGNLNAANMPHYMPAELFVRMLTGLPLTIVNVQYSATTEEVALLDRSLADFIDPPINLKNDLDDVAAILACCDLLITAHTAVMYLGAGQGLRTWSFITGQSWSTHGLPGQPLFPNVRHFTKGVKETWPKTVSEIRSVLLDLLDRQESGQRSK